MNIEDLKDELVSSHPVTGAYSADSAEAADQLNAVNCTKMYPLTMQEVREWAAEDARGFNIRQAMDDAALTDQVRNLCYIADKLIGTDDGNLTPGNPLHVGMINQIVAAGVISAADRTALVAKATRDVSRATEIGLEFVQPGHVENARM